MSNANRIGKVNDPIRTLRKIQTVMPEAIIAGGYYRDVFNNVNYGDVDIYVPHEHGIEGFNCISYSSYENLLKLKSDDFRSMDTIQELGEGDDAYDATTSSAIVKVFGMIKSQIPYNIIVVDKDPVDFVMEDFDFNICKTYCDGNKVTYTKEFMVDAEHKLLTFTNRKLKKHQHARAMDKHLPKLRWKYPNHKVIIPEIHQQMHSDYLAGR